MFLMSDGDISMFCSFFRYRIIFEVQMLMTTDWLEHFFFASSFALLCLLCSIKKTRKWHHFKHSDGTTIGQIVQTIGLRLRLGL